MGCKGWCDGEGLEGEVFLIAGLLGKEKMDFKRFSCDFC